MDVRTAIRTGNAEELRRILLADRSKANALVCYGDNCQKPTHHPLHYVADMVFSNLLAKGFKKEQHVEQANLEDVFIDLTGKGLHG